MNVLLTPVFRRGIAHGQHLRWMRSTLCLVTVLFVLPALADPSPRSLVAGSKKRCAAFFYGASGSRRRGAGLAACARIDSQAPAARCRAGRAEAQRSVLQ